MSADAKKPFYKTVWFIIILVLIAAILFTALSTLFSYGVQSAIIKVVCTDKNPSTPDGYEDVLNRTQYLAEELCYQGENNDCVMDILAPKEIDKPLPLLVYLHGGYYVGGNKEGKEPYCRMIAKEGYIVANVDYSLAPKYKYPTQLMQANDAIAYLVEHSAEYNIDSAKIFIGGDSAGSHLSGQLGAYYTNDALAEKIGVERAIPSSALKGVVLLCGFFNMQTVNEHYFFLLPSAMWMLTGKKDYLSYERIDELDTVKNVTANYPATYITCGDSDPFYTQNEEMTALLQGLGVPTVSYLPKGDKKKLKHEFQCDFSLNECEVAMDKLIEFLSDRCT